MDGMQTTRSPPDCGNYLRPTQIHHSYKWTLLYDVETCIDRSSIAEVQHCH